MILAATPRLSSELRCRCAKEDEIVDPEATVGTVNTCATCFTGYINDNGIWRNLFTLSPAKRQKLQAIGRVQQLTNHGAYDEQAQFRKLPASPEVKP